MTASCLHGRKKTKPSNTKCVPTTASLALEKVAKPPEADLETGLDDFLELKEIKT